MTKVLTKTCMRCGVTMPYEEYCDCLKEEERRSRNKRERSHKESIRQKRRVKENNKFSGWE